MAAIADDARQQPVPQTHLEESEQERRRRAAADVRNASRREQGLQTLDDVVASALKKPE